MNERQGNGETEAIEGMTLRGFGLVPEGDGQLSGVLVGSATVTRLRTACQVQTGKEAQRKAGPVTEGRGGWAVGVLTSASGAWQRAGETHGHGPVRLRVRGLGPAGSQRGSEQPGRRACPHRRRPPPMPPSSQPPLLAR